MWVAVQAALLIALIALGGSDDWPTPRWLELAGTVMVVLGLLIAAVAASGLGRLLTPTPVPRAGGQLVTAGFYRHVRHPVYSGVLLVVAGLVVASGRWLSLGLGVVAVVFFYGKSTWEEQRLAEHYPDYPAYRETTPRFLPRPGSRLRD